MNKSEEIIDKLTGLSEEDKPWDKGNPKSKHKKLTPEQKAKAKKRAKDNNRNYPNLTDNMWAANQ